MDVQQVLMGTQELLTARRVFGDPVQAGDTTIIPVAVIRGGAGGGSRTAEGGVGFGVDARPAGVFAVRGGTVAWRPAVNVNRIVMGGQLVGVVALLVLRPLVLAWIERYGKSLPRRHTEAA